MLSLLRAWVQSLVEQLGYNKQHSMAKKTEQINKYFKK